MVHVCDELGLQPIQLFESIVGHSELAVSLQEPPVEPLVLHRDPGDGEGCLQGPDVVVEIGGPVRARPEREDAEHLSSNPDRGEESEPSPVGDVSHRSVRPRSQVRDHERVRPRAGYGVPETASHAKLIRIVGSRFSV